MKTCPNCGYKLDEGMAVCPKCGEHLNQHKKPAFDTVQKRIMIILGLLLIFGNIVGLILEPVDSPIIGTWQSAPLSQNLDRHQELNIDKNGDFSSIFYIPISEEELATTAYEGHLTPTEDDRFYDVVISDYIPTTYLSQKAYIASLDGLAGYIPPMDAKNMTLNELRDDFITYMENNRENILTIHFEGTSPENAEEIAQDFYNYHLELQKNAQIESNQIVLKPNMDIDENLYLQKYQYGTDKQGYFNQLSDYYGEIRLESVDSLVWVIGGEELQFNKVE